MIDPDVLSLDELHDEAVSASEREHYGMASALWDIIRRRRYQRDAILDMAEQLDAEGLVVVPRALVAEAAFLTDRIEDFELDETDAKGMCREFCGHVLPSHERLLKLLAAAPLAPEVG